MNERLIGELSRITPEEEALLHGQKLDRERYTAPGGAFHIDSRHMLEQGKLIKVRPHTRFTPFPYHTHEYIEICYCLKGQLIHRINHQVDLTLHPGDLLFLGLQAGHEIRRAGQDDLAVNFIVQPPFFDTAFSMIGQDNVLWRFVAEGLQGAMPYLLFRAGELLPVQNLLENMIWSLLHPENNRRRITQTTMGLLFLELLSHMETGELPKREENRCVLEALREVEENYAQADLTRVAQSQGVSLSYVSAQVHRATGRTFKELLRQKRMDKAAQLLCTTTLSVQNIIVAVGYENTSYFHRAFRKTYGMTPRAYRLQQKESSRQE